MGRPKKKVETVEQPEVKGIEIPDNSNRELFLEELKRKNLHVHVESGVVMAVVTKDKISDTLIRMREIKEAVGYRGSYGATSAEKN